MNVGEIWENKDLYYLIHEKIGPIYHLTLVDGVPASDNQYNIKLAKNFYGSFERVKDCVECGTARIRHTDNTHLAIDMRCWSCKR